MPDRKIHAFTHVYVEQGTTPCGQHPPSDRTSAVHARVTCAGCQLWITKVENR